MVSFSVLENKEIRRSFFSVLFMPYNKSFIDQASSVKMAGYWPRSLFAFLWTSTSSRFIKTQKENLANIQPSWPRAWSIIYTYNPSDQARAPKGRIWRKPSEGLSYGCTAKGAHSGSGGRVAKFMVAVSYGNGVILCEQYEKLKGRYFKFSSRKRIPTNV